MVSHYFRARRALWSGSISSGGVASARKLPRVYPFGVIGRERAASSRSVGFLRALHTSGEWDVTQTVGALKVPRLVASKATPSDSDAPIEVQSTHLLTGGTGGLGLLTARWLAQEGVSTLVLASRTGRLPANASKEVELIRAAGARKIIERTT